MALQFFFFFFNLDAYSLTAMHSKLRSSLKLNWFASANKLKVDHVEKQRIWFYSGKQR